MFITSLSSLWLISLTLSLCAGTILVLSGYYTEEKLSLCPLFSPFWDLRLSLPLPPPLTPNPCLPLLPLPPPPLCLPVLFSLENMMQIWPPGAVRCFSVWSGRSDTPSAHTAPTQSRNGGCAFCTTTLSVCVCVFSYSVHFSFCPAHPLLLSVTGAQPGWQMGRTPWARRTGRRSAWSWRLCSWSSGCRSSRYGSWRQTKLVQVQLSVFDHKITQSCPSIFNQSDIIIMMTSSSPTGSK